MNAIGIAPLRLTVRVYGQFNNCVVGKIKFGATRLYRPSKCHRVNVEARDHLDYCRDALPHKFPLLEKWAELTETEVWPIV